MAHSDEENNGAEGGQEDEEWGDDADVDDGYDDRWDVQEQPVVAGGDQAASEAARSRAALSLPALCEQLQGVPPLEAEEEIRAALRRSKGKDSDADTLAMLLKVFRSTRDAALEGYEPWNTTLAYCARLTALCDKNFIGTLHSDHEQAQSDFPASAVATVYAECGRSLGLAEELQLAREYLSKGLQVFAVIPEGRGSSLALDRQRAAATAAHARVLWRLGHTEPAEKEYLQALTAFSKLPAMEEISALISELCDLLKDKAPEGFEVPDFLCELALEKFGEGSEQHLRALKDVSDACVSLGHRALAAPLLVSRAEFLRARCRTGASFPGKGARHNPNAIMQAEIEVSEEEAAQALEESVAARLSEHDLKGAMAAWEQALKFREACEGPNSQVVTEMRVALAAMRSSLGMEGGTAEGPSPQQEGDSGQKVGALKVEAAEGKAHQQVHEVTTQRPEKESSPDVAERSPSPPRVGLLTAPLVSLRPSWAQKR